MFNCQYVKFNIYEYYKIKPDQEYSETIYHFASILNRVIVKVYKETQGRADTSVMPVITRGNTNPPTNILRKRGCNKIEYSAT